MAVNPSLLAAAEEIRDATAVGENTATRVGGLLCDIVEEVGDKAETEENTGLLDPQQWPRMVIWDVNTVNPNDVNVSVGEMIISRLDGGLPVLSIFTMSLTWVEIGQPVPGWVYFDKKTSDIYVYEGIGIFTKLNPSIINNLTTGGAKDVLSAEQGKVLKTMIDNIPQQGGTPFELIDDMEDAGADTTLAAPTSRVVQEIFINLKALYDNLAGIAFVGTAPTWQTVDAPTYTLTKSLTACTASVTTGDAGGGKVNEGTVVIRLTPSTVGYSFSTISVIIGGEAVDFQRTDNIDGTVDITFTANGDITLTATAVSGYGITVNGAHITSSQSHSGSTYTVTLGTDDPHFSLPDNIVVKHGGTTLSPGVGYTYDKATGEVVIPNVNDNTYSIEVTADEDAHATISLAAGVTNVVGTHGGDSVTFPLKVYADMLVGDEYDIVFAPASGCKFTTDPNVGGVDLTDNTLTVTDTDVTGGESIDVDAAARPLNTYNISIPADANITVDDGNGGSVPATIIEDSPLTIRLTPDAGYVININTATMGGNNIASTEVEGVLTFDIAAVTGDIVIDAEAVQIVYRSVTKKLLNFTASDDGTSTTDADFGYKIKEVVHGDPYTVTLDCAGATSNDDVMVKMGGVELVAGTDYTKTTDGTETEITIPAVTDDVVIVATAHTGVVSAIANSSGAEVSLTKADNSTVTLTCDIANGDGTYSGSANIGDSSLKDFVITSKANIKSVDFGGAVYTGGASGSSKNLGNNTAADANSVIEELTGLVFYTPNNGKEFGYTFANCTNLSKIDTIGWRILKFTQYSYGPFKNCSSLKAIDISGLPFANDPTNTDGWFRGCTALSRIILPDDTSMLKNMKEWFYGCGLDKTTDTLKIEGGKITAATSLQNLAQTSKLKTLDISNIDCATITSISSMLFQSEIGELIIGNLDLSNLLYKSNWWYGTSTKVGRVVCKTTTPPGVNSEVNWLDELKSHSVPIYVPDSAVSAYTSDTYWGELDIHAVSELNSN